MESLTDRFEASLSEARGRLRDAREEYHTIESTGSAPEALIHALGELEAELKGLERKRDLSGEHIQIADRTTRRAALLEDILGKLRTRHDERIEADVQRSRYWVDALSGVGDSHELTESLEGEIGELERQCTMLERLAQVGKHEKAVTSDRVSLAALENQLRAVDSTVSDVVDTDTYVHLCVDLAGVLMDPIHEALGGLDTNHPDRTTYADTLRDTKARIDTADAALQDGDGEAAVADARTALEGCLMLHFLTSRSSIEQRVADRLAETLMDNEIEVDCDPAALASSGDVEGLLEACTDAVGAEVQLSERTRVRRLIQEHDGSVVRTIVATDFEATTVFEHLETMYLDDQLTELTAEFVQ